MSHEVIIIHNGEGPGGEVHSTLSYKPSHNLSDDEQFKRLKHANKVLDRLSDYLYAPAGASPPEDV
jgi:hypothetical protein